MKELTTSEVAERLGVAQVTVRLWCKQGRFPNARLVEHPRGDYWVIPPDDLEGVGPRKPGPVPKPKANGGASTGETKAGRKAISRWENEGGATPKAAKKGRRK